MNAIFELWAQIMPERAMACSFNLEYLLVGGRDARTDERPYFMWYDWMVGGWGGRNGKDGVQLHVARCSASGWPCSRSRARSASRPCSPPGHELLTDSGGPGRFRGGCGVEKGGTLTRAEATVVSYCCDRARSITWGMSGGLPSLPHGVWLNRGSEDERFLGSIFSNVPLVPGDRFTRPSAGGGGFGDPLERDPAAVREDVADGYVTLERAAHRLRGGRARGGRRPVGIRGRCRGHGGRARAHPRRPRGLAVRGRRGRRRGATARASWTCSTSSATTA